MLSRPQLDSGSAIPLLPSGRGARLNPMLTRLAGWGYARAPLLPRSFRQVAAAHGAENLRTVADLLGADVTLFTVMEDELSGTELPASMHRVGPIFARLPGEIPEVVRKLAAASRPVVYLAFGSSGSRRVVLDACRALVDLPISVLASVRGYLERKDLGAVPGLDSPDPLEWSEELMLQLVTEVFPRELPDRLNDPPAGNFIAARGADG